ncbi:nuclear transport factor 2 family protein [Natronolimnobius baerhuensis]|uniref:SnoaL-like domain-containing protein n=1 Tax=Natronolimnobius baerhuensis TaxID=253108 RepID=A0A202EB79_9EURY|nr:nuclear transport factor 2 family protein [Natronolimnobius baerhuensis]OVE85516.1 hypothetical protein B2G88_01445 [Natronolimnobius baerhuensis]
MATDDRADLIQAYFDAMDEEDPAIARDALADEFVYESLSGTLEGFDGFARYVNELRGLSNSTHEVSLLVHDEDASVAEGTVTGEKDDGTLEAKFCDVVEFDEHEESITRISVYLNDA